MTQRHADAPLATDAATAKTSRQRTIDALIQASPSVLLLRDGELVLYRRTRSLLYQCRFNARELAFPFVIGRLTHAVLPARLADLGAQLDLLEDGNDLAFTESGFLHVETPLVGILYSQLDQVSEGASVSQGQSSLAHAGMLRAARALTATAIELVQRPELIAQAKAELVERRQGKPYQCPIPAEAPLPF